MSELVDKALAEVEASPTKTLPKPKLRQLYGMNLDDKGVAAFWDRIKYPAYEKILPNIKSKLTSVGVLANQEDGALVKKAEELLSGALSEREEQEIANQIKTYAK